jgi:hypothetical protein
VDKRRICTFFVAGNSYLPRNNWLQGFVVLLIAANVNRPTDGKKEVMINSNATHNADDPLASEKIQVDRKVFFLDLKENQRGRFLKITEDVSGRRDTIMLPASGFRDFVDALSRIVDLEQRL